MNHKQLMIDETNFNYLVFKEHRGYEISISYRIPRKSKKGFVGSKLHSESIQLDSVYKDLAYSRFDNWICEYKTKLDKKEIIAFYVNLFPKIRYYCVCPYCGGEAEIITWMIGVEYGVGTDNSESHSIICENCPQVLNKQDALYNPVGICYKILFHNEGEKNYQEELNVTNLKWEDWLNDNKISETKKL